MGVLRSRAMLQGVLHLYESMQCAPPSRCRSAVQRVRGPHSDERVLSELLIQACIAGTNYPLLAAG